MEGKKNRWWLFGVGLNLRSRWWLLTFLFIASLPLLLLTKLLLTIPRDNSNNNNDTIIIKSHYISNSAEKQWLLLQQPADTWPPEVDEQPEVSSDSSPNTEADAEADANTSSKLSFMNERDFVIETSGSLKASDQSLLLFNSDKDSSATMEETTKQKEQRKRKRKRRFSRTERKPILNEFSFPANLVQGMRFVLMCQVLDGESPIQIKWFKDNDELITLSDSSTSGLILQPTNSNKQVSNGANSEQVELISNDELGASLLFRKVQQQHSGNYTCLASNQYGSTSYSSFMSVKVPPTWKVEPQDQHSIMGDQITIDCQAFGNPNPFIRWKFTQQQNLATAQQQAESDALTAANSNSNSNSMAFFSVATNLPQNANFKLINSNHHVQTLENGSLTIRQVQKEHEGYYLCEADNGVEPNLMKALRLIVHLQAQFADDLQVIDPQTNQRQLVSQQATSVLATTSSAAATNQLVAAKAVRLALGTSQMRILCQPLGDQPLTLEWLKDGQVIYTHTTQDDSLSGGSIKQPPRNHSPVSSSSSSVIQNSLKSNEASNHHVNTRPSLQRPSIGLDSELVVTNIRRQDAGLYSCLARNAFGQAERRLRLIVQEPPEAPEMVDVAHIGSRSIALRWLVPFDGNSPIVKYTVEYKRSQNSKFDHSSIDNAATATSLPSNGDQSYVGQSDRLMGPKLEQSQQQQTVQVANLAAASTLPVLAPTQQQQQQQVQHTIHDLDPLTSYSMRVVAVNAIGRSRPSVALSLRTDEEVPSIVPSLVEALVLSSKSIKLRWSITYSPAHEIINGFFIGYRSLEQAPLQSSSSSPISPALRPLNQASNSLEQPTFTYKTIRLTNSQQQQQQATVASGNSMDLQQHQQATSGASEFSPVDQSSGQTEVQDQRTSSQQAATDTSSAFLSPVSSITKTLPATVSTHPFSQQQQNNINQQQQQQQQVVVVSAFEYVINGLDRNTEYTILIQCFNRKGAGPTSDPVVFKTLMNDPPEKLILSTDEIKESSLRLSWRFVMGSDRYNVVASNALRSQEPVDGFVLTFAKIQNNQLIKQTNGRQQIGFDSSTTLNREDNLKRAQPAARISNQQQQQPPVDQWQALQLAPQQRSHQLKNLECGTAYVMKIWAFNKIGNGEASDLITVRTQGKAPIAPEKRSFLSINSTQIRLHLSAWYDGGCEIDKFIVQYRLRGQQEWLLVSNNILKEQASVIIRDLLPATSYEILVGAHNQVATTEARYRIITLDSDGKPVSHSFLSNLPSLGGGDDLDEDPVDYTDPDGTRRSQSSDQWPHQHDNVAYRSVALFRHLLNSPMALILSLCLFVVIIMLLLLYKFNSFSQSSNLNSNKTSGSGSGGGGGNSVRRMNCDASANMLDEEGAPMSLTNDSPGDSPHLLAGHLTAAQRIHGFGPTVDSECQYQSFCSAAAANNNNAVDYGRTYGGQDYPNIGSYGTAANYTTIGPYTSVQRSATMDAAASSASGLGLENSPDQRQQQCLMQMLLMGPQQQQQQQIDNGSYAAALTTLARNNKSKLTNQHNNYTNHFAGANTLGRHTALDYHRLQQQQQHSPQQQVGAFSSGKHQQLILTAGSTASNLIEDHQSSNNFSMATLQNQQQQNNDNQDEVYSMSTFTQHQTVGGGNLLAQLNNGQTVAATATTYCGSSTTSTSGCGTATSSNGTLDNAPTEQLASNHLNSYSHLPAPLVNQHDNELAMNLVPFNNNNNIEQQHQTINDTNNINNSSLLMSSNASNNRNDLKTCDKPKSQYDVPFKFVNQISTNKIETSNEKEESEFGSNICY